MYASTNKVLPKHSPLCCAVPQHETQYSSMAPQYAETVNESKGISTVKGCWVLGVEELPTPRFWHSHTAAGNTLWDVAWVSETKTELHYSRQEQGFADIRQLLLDAGSSPLEVILNTQGISLKDVIIHSMILTRSMTCSLAKSSSHSTGF